ncbi:MAG: CBS domain-containing protein [Candidatus Magasanikbacteria bacterium]|nr:CBS domain-containing protein [Candidatus Magasanikbacteria bacterium]
MYLSKVLNRTVVDSSDARIGKLEDILVSPVPGSYAPVTFLLVKTRRGEERFIPFEAVSNLGGDGVSLKYLFASLPVVAPPQEAIRLVRDVLDQQIVDVEGARVVRVNDLKFGTVGAALSVIGIDVSWRGVLRRLGLSGLDIFNVFKINLIDWRSAEPLKGTLKIDTVSQKLTTIHPADLANIVEDLNVKQGSHLVSALDSKTAAKVIEEMSPEIQRLVIRYLGPERASKILERMSIDEAVDLLKMMSASEARKFLSFLQDLQSKKMERLLAYENDTAGGMMTLDYVTARPEWTVAETIDEIRRASPQLRSILYVYITDEKNKLKGAVSLRTLVVAKPDRALKEVMKRLPKNSILRLHDHVNRIVRVMTKYNLFTAAIVDHDHKLAGVLTIDDVMRHLVPNA